MSPTEAGYRVVPFPKARHVYIDSLYLGQRKHTVRGLIEADVTGARQFIRQHKAKTGKTLSFTAFLIAAVGKAVERNKYMHAYRNWRGQLVLFDEVDVTSMFEIEADGERLPLARIIRAANKRTCWEIHDEVRSVQAERRREKSLPYARLLCLYPLVPAFIRRLAYRVLLKNPHWIKRFIGTVQVTAVGMFGKGGGWAITRPFYTLAIAVGGIAERTQMVDGRIETREFLSLTLSFDHDILDGGPAARFTQHLKELIESGYGLVEPDTQAEQAPSQTATPGIDVAPV
jgi:pyruvate/2-oxoglutarate dehydrogenase complex dihydrolipoamide acyltransferase (E2) component